MTSHDGKLDAVVVVPVCNASEQLPVQLEALSRQTFTGAWAVVVADNGSVDSTVAVARSWRNRLSCLSVVRAAEPGASRRGLWAPGHARNVGAAWAGRGADVLAFCDADDIVEPDWLEHLVTALDRYPAVGGRLEYERWNSERSRWWNHELQSDELPDSFDFLPYAISANLGVRRDAFWDVGGFDERYMTACDDVDLSWRLQLAGHDLGFAHSAVVHYVHRTTFTGLARQGYRYGRAQPWLYRTYRRHGMPWTPSDPVRTWRYLLTQIPAVLRKQASARRWTRQVAMRLGRASGSIRHRVLYL